MLEQPTATSFSVSRSNAGGHFNGTRDTAPVAFGYHITPEHDSGNEEELLNLRQCYSSLLIQMDRLRPQLASVDVLYRPEAPNEWSIKEILGHIIDSDRDIWWPCIEEILESDSPRFVHIDQHELIRQHRWQSIPLEDIFAQLMRVRWNYAMQLSQIPVDAFSRIGEDPVLGVLTTFQIVNILIAHDAHYLGKIQSLIEKTQA